MSAITSRGVRVYDWLDERTNLRGLLRGALDEPIRGGARWAYVFGSTLLFLFGLQVVTGIFLAMYYVPSADHAHASVAYIQKAVAGGALLRGLHYYGASAMIILVIAHLTQTLVYGAYKDKRELLWVVGGVMLLIVLGFAFTGYLLPWDQAAFFGTKVGTSIAGEIPVVGPVQQRIMLGGTELSTLTLSRFFMVHVFLLPLTLGLLAVLHVYLFRRARPAGPFHGRTDHRVERFYPKQLLKDSLFALFVFIILVVLAERVPADLGPQADPTSDFLARPPWFFLPLFQLLKYFPGKLSLIPTVGLPAVLFGIIFLLPFFDRRAERHPLRRPVVTAVLVFALVGAVGLMALSKYQDRSNPEFDAKLKQQGEEAQAFLSAPFQPQEIGNRPARLLSKAPVAYSANCAACHGDHGEGDVGPTLIGIATKPGRSAEDLTRLLKNSRAFGLKDPMPESFPDVTEEDRRAIVDWLVKLKSE